MENTNFDIILNALRDNRNFYDTNDQYRDVNLICNLLRVKYNNTEIEDISSILINKINQCLTKSDSWFTNY